MEFDYVPPSSSSLLNSRMVPKGTVSGAVPAWREGNPAQKWRWWDYLIALSILSLFFCPLLIAHQLDNVGKTYPIDEPDLIDVLMMKAEEIKPQLLEFSQTMEAQLASKFEQPNVGVIPPIAFENSYRHIDMSVELSQDLMDKNGRIIAANGNKINPLQYVQLKSPLLFIDGNDQKQIQWAQKSLRKNPESKLILLSGNPLVISQQINHKVYFDQLGRLKIRFGITAVPSRVTQDGDKLLIEEVAL